MKKVFLLFGFLLLVIGGVVFMQNYINGGNISFFKKTPTVTINGQSFKATTATTEPEREIGLSNTASLPQDQGMIFIFEKPDFYSFWMKNMKFPIDIIYINNDTIVTIASNAQPPKENNENLIIYTPTAQADKVLEISAGLSEKYKFKNGDKVTITGL